MGVGKTRNLMWLSRRNHRFSGSGGRNRGGLVLKISAIDLHRAGGLKCGGGDIHFLLAEQVFFINWTVTERQWRNLMSTGGSKLKDRSDVCVEADLEPGFCEVIYHVP